MRLLHYSRSPTLGPLWSADNEMVQTRWSCDKPLGLWVTTDSDDNWAAWCRAESWGLDRMSYVHEVWLRPFPKILRIETEADMKAFNAEYRHEQNRFSNIDWYRVVEHHDGILIAPYRWECRFSMNWYYGWDCASGVIWDVSAIEHTELISPDRPLEL